MKNLLEINNVNKKYKSFELKDVSFNVPSGSIVGFIGRNGAGKTTTLKGIMNLVHFDSGEVKAFELDMKEHELEVKQKIGFSLSELSFYQDRKIKNLANVVGKFYKDFSKEKFDKLCERFELDQNKKLEELSSGMKVKFSLSLALSHNAELLILDEPTSGIDPLSRDEILDLFENIVHKENRAILFSTHITSDLDKCATHIVYIKNGQIVYSGLKQEFIDSYMVFEVPKDKFVEEPEIIGYKKHLDSIIGLIHVKDKEKFKKLKMKKPDLQDIMVYFEKEDNNEEFDL